MVRSVLFRPEAEADVLQTREWYESRQLDLGDEFANQVDATLARIVERPLAFPQVQGETRRAVLHRFPYAIYFRLVDDETVVVLALHGRQHPSRWRLRS